MPAPPRPERASGIQAVARAAEILNLLTLGDRTTTVAEASAALGIERTTMHRYLSTLEQVGLIDRLHEGERKGRFILGPLARQICTAVLADNSVVDIAASRLQDLADQTRATAVICFWGRGHATVAHLAYPYNEPLPIRVQIGDQLSLYSAHSRLFLALRGDQERMAEIVQGAPAELRRSLQDGVEQARTDHFAEQPFTHSIRVIAVPVFDRDKIVATVGLVSTFDVLPEGKDSDQAKLLQRTAAEVGDLLRNHPGVVNNSPSNGIIPGLPGGARPRGRGVTSGRDLSVAGSEA